MIGHRALLAHLRIRRRIRPVILTNVRRSIHHIREGCIVNHAKSVEFAALSSVAAISTEEIVWWKHRCFSVVGEAR